MSIAVPRGRDWMAAPTVTGRACDGFGQAGFSLLGLLFVVAGLGIAMAAVGTIWHTASKREKEAELLFVGNQFRQAIESFWNRSPGNKRLPRDLEELVTDPRFPNAVRHLRRIYRDPVTGKSEWGLVKQPDGGIAGVHSLSGDAPMKRSGFAAANQDFMKAQSYEEWIFQFEVEKAQKADKAPPAADQKNTQPKDAAKSAAPSKATP